MEPAFVILKNCWCVHLHFVIYLLLLWYFSVCYRCCCLANNDVSATDWHNSWIVFMVQCTVFHIFLKEKGFSNVRKKRQWKERKKEEREARGVRYEWTVSGQGFTRMYCKHVRWVGMRSVLSGPTCVLSLSCSRKQGIPGSRVSDIRQSRLFLGGRSRERER